MALSTEWRGYDGSGWNIVIGASDRVYFGGNPSGIGPVIADAWQTATHRANGAADTDLCTPNHMRNCRYVSPTQVSLMEAAAVDLTYANVKEQDCTLRITISDSVAFSTENVVLYADDGVTSTTPPTDIVIVGFSSMASAIWKDRINAVPPFNHAWDDAFGIGGYDNALDLPSFITPATQRFYYVGLSVKSASNGLKTAFRLAFQYDAT